MHVRRAECPAGSVCSACCCPLSRAGGAVCTQTLRTYSSGDGVWEDGRGKGSVSRSEALFLLEHPFHRYGRLCDLSVSQEDVCNRLLHPVRGRARIYSLPPPAPLFLCRMTCPLYINSVSFQVVLGRRALGMLLYLKGKRVVQGRR